MKTTSATVASLEAKLQAQSEQINALMAMLSGKAHDAITSKASKTKPAKDDARSEAFRRIRNGEKGVKIPKATITAPIAKAIETPKAKAFEGITATQAKLGRTHLHGKDAIAKKPGVYTTKYARVVAHSLGINVSDAQYVNAKSSKGSSKYEPTGKGYNYVITIK